MRLARGGDGLAAFAALLVALLLAGCASGGGALLADPPVIRATPPPTPARASVPPDPQPIAFPRDDGPHDRLTEWWYYTGHLATADGHRFGFEYVVFRAERGPLPVTWASHLALTDESGGAFHYAQRSEVGPQVDASPRDAAGVPTGFALALAATDASGRPTEAGSAWTMAGSGGQDALRAALSPAEAAAAGLPGGFGLDLRLSASRPPVLHRGAGWIDFGPAGGSYYYSRTRLAASGTLTLAGRQLAVSGSAWFDHQWGDFIAVGAGGWDWFAVNLADGTDLTLSLVRDAGGGYPLVYGTLTEPDGTTRDLEGADFSVTPIGRWTSPRSGATYPAGWTVRIPGASLVIDLRPTVADQELDTRATTGVVYWEGSQVVRATRAGRPMGGQAYVELTGYAQGVPTNR
ncbi:MAG TPA: lipocalin family protein [Candidatus Limnocylindrales bacterium]